MNPPSFGFGAGGAGGACAFTLETWTGAGVPEPKQERAKPIGSCAEARLWPRTLLFQGTKPARGCQKKLTSRFVCI
eukprot:scaffold435_cov342-Pavlova_lutheri.AAC.49